MREEPVLSEELEREVDARARALAGEDSGLGYCHRVWAMKKKILLEEFGIDWKTPAERYPTIIFD